MFSLCLSASDMCFSYLLHRDYGHTQLHNSGVLSQRKDRFHRSVPGNVRAGILEDASSFVITQLCRLFAGPMT